MKFLPFNFKKPGDTLFVAGLLALSTTSPLHAENLPPEAALSVSAAMEEAKSNSPKIQKAQSAVDEAHWKHRESWAGFLPTVSAAASHFFSLQYQILNVALPGGPPFAFPEVFPASTVALDASLVLFDGLANINRFKGSSKLENAAEAEESWAEFEVEQDIRLKFFQALGAEKLLGVAHQNIATVTDHLKRVTALRRGGEATNFDVLRVEVQLNDAQAEELAAQDNVVLARRKLAEAMGNDNDKRPLDGELPVPSAKGIQEVSAPDFNHRSDLEAVLDRVEASKNEKEAMAYFWIPKVSLAGEYAYYNNVDKSITSNFSDSYQFGIFLSWNLFDGGASWARAHEAAAQSAQAEKSARMAQLHAPVDFEFWKRRYVYSTTLYTARKSDVVKSDESVRLAQDGLRAGTRTTTETLDAELELFRARAGVINAQMSSLEALINLELALGRKI